MDVQYQLQVKGGNLETCFAKLSFRKPTARKRFANSANKSGFDFLNIAIRSNCTDV